MKFLQKMFWCIIAVFIANLVWYYGRYFADPRKWEANNSIPLNLPPLLLGISTGIVLAILGAITLCLRKRKKP